MLPFDAEVLASSYALYNAAIWPAQAVALALALVAVWFGLRPRRGGDRVPGLLLAVGWLWCGAVFFLHHFARLDFMAPVYGWAFVFQAALLVWALVWRRAAFRFCPDLFGLAGLMLMAVALVGLPLVSGITEAGLGSARLAGVAPGPTALFTLGLLLLAERRVPWTLLIIPTLWCAVAGATAWALGVPEDWPLPVLGAAALALAVLKHRRAA